jgi:hypothetical protein
MRLLCAWHQKYFGHEFVIKEDDGSGEEGDSHGICPACEEIEMKKLKEAQASRYFDKVKRSRARLQPLFDDKSVMGTSDPDPEPREADNV